MMKEEAFGTSDKDRLALERTASVLIEAVIDVGNQMIDAFIMRDPGGTKILSTSCLMKKSL